MRVLQRRPANPIDRWEDGRYRRTIRIDDQPVLVEVFNAGSTETPNVRLRVLANKLSVTQRSKVERIVSEVLGADADPTGPQARASAEPALRETALALRGMRPPRYPELLETFVNVIPFQQVSLESGMATVARIVRRFGGGLTVDGQRYCLFPTVEAIASARVTSLRACGLSAHKSRALLAVAREIASDNLTAGELAGLSTTAAMERLMRLSGIGPWSAALVLLRGFRRMDVFPQADTGAESGLTKLLRLRSKAALTPVIDRFGDYRGYLYFYGLASRLLQAGLIHPATTQAQPPGRVAVMRDERGG